jgi:hypothetical protein
MQKPRNSGAWRNIEYASLIDSTCLPVTQVVLEIEKILILDLQEKQP